VFVCGFSPANTRTGIVWAGLTLDGIVWAACGMDGIV